jgi:hypothetical protein
MATTKRLRSQRRQPTTAADAGAPWSEPQIAGRFETAIGSSIVEQIVIGHTPADVLRELVQNEFDARGHRMHVTFGPEHLNVTGSGKPVDKAGWERLSVILGTGVVSVSASFDLPMKPPVTPLAPSPRPRPTSSLAASERRVRCCSHTSNASSDSTNYDCGVTG